MMFKPSSVPLLAVPNASFVRPVVARLKRRRIGLRVRARQVDFCAFSSLHSVLASVRANSLECNFRDINEDQASSSTEPQEGELRIKLEAGKEETERSCKK